MSYNIPKNLLDTNTSNSLLLQDGSRTNPAISFASQTNMGITRSANYQLGLVAGLSKGAVVGMNYIHIGSTSYYGWRTAEAIGQGTANETRLRREDKGVLGITTYDDSPTGLHLHNTYTDASNYERLEIKWDTDVCYLDATSAGTGTDRNLYLRAGGDSGVKIKGNAVDIFANNWNTAAMTFGASSIRAYKPIIPINDSNQYLGSTGSRFAYLYTDEVRIGDGVDAVLTADADNVLALKNSTNNQEFRVYITDDGAGNTEYGFMNYYSVSNRFDIGTQSTGTGSNRTIQFSTGGTGRVLVSSAGLGMLTKIYAAISNLDIGQAASPFRDIYGETLSLGTNNDPAQFNVYNTYTDASNYERLEFKWDTNVATISTAAAGTGTLRQLNVNGDGIVFQDTGVNKLAIGSTINYSYQTFQPGSDSVHSLGASPRRWSTTFTDGIATDVETFTATDTLDSKNHVCLCNATSGNITLNLPVASSTPVGTQYQIKKIDSSSNTVIITPNSGGGDLIDGSTTYTLSNQWEGVIIVCDGGDWYVTGGVTNSGGGGGGGGGLGGGD